MAADSPLWLLSLVTVTGALKATLFSCGIIPARPGPVVTVAKCAQVAELSVIRYGWRASGRVTLAQSHGSRPVARPAPA
jgi:hypothetical protein